MKLSHLTVALSIVACSALSMAQTPRPVQRPRLPASDTPAPIISPEVHPDNSVTFRFRDPNAKEVLLSREGIQKPIPMQKDDQGVWSVTAGPWEPALYGYTIIADGVSLFDPSNWRRIPNFLYVASEVHVPGPESLPWEVNDIPHGIVHHHFYHSNVVGDDRDFYVYTPPDYDPQRKEEYPVLYLLHGYSDDASGWTAVGRANVIMDNLIAQGKIKPMLVVMPLGYGAPEILSRGFSRFANLREKNMTKFRDALITEVIPQVERDYHASSDRESRAIAGLSMGGAESLFTGLNNIDKFAWVGAFSSGGLNQDFSAEFPNLDSKANDELHLLWIACGTEDGLIGPNRKFREWLDSKNIHHTSIETPGMHTWMVWRRNLSTFAPLLFQK
jgi:enterochelin esterase-like enzyme